MTTVKKTTWLTPFADTWKKNYGGELPMKKAAAALKPVVDELGTVEAERRFSEYCRITVGQYADVVRFAQRHGTFSKVQPLSLGQQTPRRAATAKRVI